jgi:LPS O-antigen subunit length determinant protein (WzzB/FepE family)
MQTNTPEQNYYQEDEIDLKELFGVLWAKKTLIISITAVITIMAGIYAFNKTPIYEATALVEIGNYNNNNNNNNNNKVLVDSVPELVKKLNSLFIEIAKNEKNKTASITSISTSKGVTGFFDIKSESSSNELATNEINKVVTHIKNKHQIIIDNVKNRIKLESKNIQANIDNIKNIDIKLLVDRVNSRQKTLKQYQIHLSQLIVIKDTTIKENPTLIDLKQAEFELSIKRDSFSKKREVLNSINAIESEIESMQNSINILDRKIYSLSKQKELIDTSHNYKNSEVIGQVITNDYPTKPKKKLIVVVAFIAGFILSIFLVFIMNAFRKEDDKVSA